MTKSPDARSIATQILTQVLGQRHSLADAFVVYLPSLTDAREKALVQLLCYGVMRWLPRLQALLAQLLNKPLKPKECDIQVLLLIGLYQQIYTRIPPHAAIAATVEVTRVLKKTWATKLVNGVLRQFQRQKTVLLPQVDQQLPARLAHPSWWLKRLQSDWPGKWQAIAQANNQHPPFTLRVNQRQLSRQSYLAQLAAQGIEATPMPVVDFGVSLTQPMDVQQLPGFAQGWVSVQDGAAQIAADLLTIPPDGRVLDACAAPGGKTAHLLEKFSLKTLVAIDHQPQRVQQIEDNLTRLQLKQNTQVICADASQPDSWWDKQPFDCILLDVPCSASGVIRRHPDIKFLRRPADIAALAQQQARLLQALWPLLAVGGQLLYVTCSVFATENQQQIEKFLAQQRNASIRPLPGQWGKDLTVGRQILPSDDALFDGFYYASLGKSA